MKLMVLLYILLILSLSATVPLESKKQCKEVYQYQLSSSFSTREKKNILLAFDAWSDVSGRAICFLPGDNGLKINRADTLDVVQDLDKKAYDKYHIEIIGWAEGENAWVFPDRIETDYDFFSTSLHEIGHLLGLNHYDGPNQSHMRFYGSPEGELYHATEQDRILLCSIHSCNLSAP